jgi:hypothetical protein
MELLSISYRLSGGRDVFPECHADMQGNSMPWSRRRPDTLLRQASAHDQVFRHNPIIRLWTPWLCSAGFASSAADSNSVKDH